MLELKMTMSWNYKGQRGRETFFHTAIGSFIAALRSWEPAFRAMVPVIEDSIEEQFATEGHGSWAELAPATVERKGFDTILIETGEMLASFKHGGAHNVTEIGRESFRFGSDLPRSLFHQTGTGSGFQLQHKGPGRGMPMRKIFDFTSTTKGGLRSIMVRHLATLARREGFAVMGGTETDPLSARKLGETMLGL